MLMKLLRRLFVQRKSARLFAEAQRLFREGAFEEAERAASEYAKLSSDLADVHYLRALIALAQERHESAARHLEAAVAERDSDPAFHSKLAEVLQKLGRHESAALHYARAFEHLPPSDPRRGAPRLRLAPPPPRSHTQRQARERGRE